MAHSVSVHLGSLTHRRRQESRSQKVARIETEQARIIARFKGIRLGASVHRLDDTTTGTVVRLTGFRVWVRWDADGSVTEVSLAVLQGS